MINVLKLIRFVGFFNLRVNPRFFGLLTVFINRNPPFKNTAAANRYLFLVGWKHQINLRFDVLIAKNVRIDRLRSSKRNYLFVFPKTYRTRRTHARAHRF